MGYDTPTAAYDNSRLLQNRDVKIGKRGFSGMKDSLTTSLTGANNDLVITSKVARTSSWTAIAVQYAVLGNNAPARLYEDGYPAQLIPSTNLGFSLIARVPGPLGNQLSLTLVDPRKVAPLMVRSAAQDSIVVQLARGVSGLTTTPAQLVAALNANSLVAQRMIAYISDSSVTTALPALGPVPFFGGREVPGLVLVGLANTDGTITATGSQVAALLNSGRYVRAVNSGSDTGAGAVTVMAPTPLIGGTVSRGDLGDQSIERKMERSLALRPGQPIGAEGTETTEVDVGRVGAFRNDFLVPAGDRAIVASSPVNYQREHGPRTSRWF